MQDRTEDQRSIGSSIVTNKFINNSIDLEKEFFSKNGNGNAISYNSKYVSYNELNKTANNLAFKLKSLGITPGDVVAIYLERSVELVIAILGTLRAGAAFLPLDTELPENRIQHVLHDSDARVVLTSNQLFAKCETLAHQQSIIDLNADLANEPANLDNVDITSPAYVIYTSGSTGEPKGVNMPLKALLNLVKSQAKATQLFNQPLSTLQFTSIGFDVAVQEILTTLASGGCLHLIDNATRKDSRLLASYISEHQIERIFMPNQVLQNLAHEFLFDQSLDCSQLKLIVTAGEQLVMSSALVEWLEKTNAKLVNHYGPTETHVATHYTSDAPYSQWEKLPPIGRALDNIKTFVLDSELNPVAVGEEGELYIGGDCLALGYINKPELTRERFISIPDLENSKTNVYRTGDLVVQRPNGDLVYKGRIDRQVKIRGFRIEPGEIEHRLLEISDIQQAVVAPQTSPNNEVLLVAYIVTDQKVELENTCNTYLGNSLPSYMLPNAYVTVDAIPLTPNGKVNFSALPKPQFGLPDKTATPPDRRASVVRDIFSTVLGHDGFSDTDNFFNVGGNSLSAMRLLRLLTERMGKKISYAQFSENPSVSNLEPIISSAICNNQAEKSEAKS